MYFCIGMRRTPDIIVPMKPGSVQAEGNMPPEECSVQQAWSRESATGGADGRVCYLPGSQASLQAAQTWSSGCVNWRTLGAQVWQCKACGSLNHQKLLASRTALS
jgi:hypothetical protein